MPMTRSPFKPRKGKVWKRLSPVSKSPHRLAKRFVPAASIKAVRERSGGICEVYIDFPVTSNSPRSEQARANYYYGVRCRRPAERQPHHILKRSRGGTHDLENLLAVCFECHNWIEGNEAEAVKRGLSLPYKGFKP